MLPTIGIWLRIFPVLNRDWENFKVDTDLKIIHVRSPEDMRRKEKPNNLYWQFKMDEILQNASQQECYDSIFHKELTENIMSGYNLTIFGFGNSGTGKTYTLFGPNNTYELRGIIPRLLEYLFEKKKELTYHEVRLSLKYVELFGKDIYNLLKTGKPKVNYNVKAVDIDGLCEAFKLIQTGNNQRKVENIANHCGTAILTIILSKYPKGQRESITTTSIINIVDTGGTEFGRIRLKSMKCHVNANLVKSQLSALCSWTEQSLKGSTAILRNSPLADYLGQALNTGFIRLIGHVAGNREAIPEAISTLLFCSKMVKLPCPRLVQAKFRDPNVYINLLKDEIFELRGMINVNNIAGGIYRAGVASQSQMKHAMQLVKSFLNSETDLESVMEIAQPQLLLQIFKDIFESTLNETQELKDELKILKMEHDAIRHKSPELDQKIKLFRKKASMTSIRSKKENVRKKKSAYTRAVDDLEGSEATFKGEEEHHNRLSKTNEYSLPFLNTEEIGECNFKKTFQEFINSNAQLMAKITHYKQDMEENLITKFELTQEMTKLRHKLKDLNLSVEEEKWGAMINEKDNGLFDQNGKRQPRFAVQDALELEIADISRSLAQTRKNAIAAHTAYMAASRALNDVLTVAEEFHNEYVRNTYSSTLVIPPVDIYKGIPTSIEQMQSPTEEIKKCYEYI